MQLIHTIAQTRSLVSTARAAGGTVVLVPTMGFFHEGHLDLMRFARALANERAKGGLVLVSNFVNPTQFGPNEDLKNYPRDLGRDARMAEGVGADAMFCPAPEEMYPAGYLTSVRVGDMGRVLCGADRPTHFDGVATVVLKLFNIVEPDHAIFGWKDAQQFLILKRMARDLDLRVRLHGVETRREEDGLAMSSRNVYLAPEERAAAPILRRELLRLGDSIARGMADLPAALESLRAALAAEPTAKLVYAEARRMSDLEPLDSWEPGNTLVALACRFGKARLIDNVRF